MTSSSRRPGFRLPWTAEETNGNGEASAENAGTAIANGEASTSRAPVASSTDAPKEGASSGTAVPPATGSAAAAAMKGPMNRPDDATAEAEEAATPSTHPAAPSGAPTVSGDNPFLRNLVEAMRQVAEETRSKSVDELRSGVDGRIGALRSASEDRAAAMRKLADDEIAAVGTWETTEIERIRLEAKRRAEERRTRLENEIAEDARRTEQEIEETKRAATAYEGELDTFLASLSGIRDPGEFVAAAQRMPAPPLATQRPVAETGPANVAAEPSAPAPVANAEEPATAATDDASAVEAPSAEPEPVAAAAEPAPTADQPQPAPTPVAPAPAPVEPGAETATSVVVKGLGSFGAITSFKQSLERAGGIRSVALSLGPTGEFVYRATHSAETDLAAVLAAIEEGSTVERQPDGSLRVTVGRAR